MVEGGGGIGDGEDETGRRGGAGGEGGVCGGDGGGGGGVGGRGAGEQKQSRRGLPAEGNPHAYAGSCSEQKSVHSDGSLRAISSKVAGVRVWQPSMDAQPSP